MLLNILLNLFLIVAESNIDSKKIIEISLNLETINYTWHAHRTNATRVHIY